MTTKIAPPPVAMMYDGPAEEWESNGREYLEIYKTLAGLTPDVTMLDVGSGIGRKSIPLTEYLSPNAVYEGFDCAQMGVSWCQANITPAFPNFRFQHVNVYAPGYNQQGTIPAADVRFPYDNEMFDFVVLNSVFTHMQYTDMLHYMHEIVRVLKPGGKCLISYFLLGDVRYAAARMFPHMLGTHCRVASLHMPEQAIAYHTQSVKDMYAANGLHIQRLKLGTWDDSIVPEPRDKPQTYQDLILAVKP